MQKIRLDVLMTERGLAESRSQAQRLVMAGQVRVDGQLVKAWLTNSCLAWPSPWTAAALRLARRGKTGSGCRRLSNLTDLGGRACADIGASTGGFTDCLLQHGAGKVYAVDVGYGELHWKLRNDPRVVVMERTNARYVQGFPEPVSW
jgi:23S rRNA (cytidine1920-2'-O)/16S rRNA (cytidine1409-2'-O)-methyltransferase